jgi:hypothetical protein
VQPDRDVDRRCQLGQLQSLGELTSMSIQSETRGEGWHGLELISQGQRLLPKFNREALRGVGKIVTSFLAPGAVFGDVHDQGEHASGRCEHLHVDAADPHALGPF